jgi:hypothetical protein
MEVAENHRCWNGEKNLYCRVILKKSASILLLLIFLFNTIGYKALFFYLEKEADARIEAKIRTIDELDKRLITIKLPINLPYQTDWREFESIDGEMTFKGKTYKYVKRKVMRDTLVLLCIDHSEKSRLEKGSAEYFKKVNDLTTESQKKPVLKQAKTDYYQEVKDLVAYSLARLNKHYKTPDFTPPIAAGYSLMAEMPPEKHTSC